MVSREACIICLELVEQGKSGKPAALDCACRVSIHPHCWIEYSKRKGMECPFCHTVKLEEEIQGVEESHRNAALCCCSCMILWGIVVNVLEAISG